MAFFGMGSGMAAYAEEQQKRGRKTDARTLRRVAVAFRPYTFQVILVLLAILLTTALGLVNPLLVQHVFDDAIGRRNMRLLIIYVVIMCLVPIASGIIGVGQTYLNNTVGQNLMRDFRNRLYAHLQRMPLRFFTATRTGEIQSRLTNDVGGVQGVVTNTATTIVSNLSTVLSTIIAMALISPLLTLISLGLLPLFLWITYKVGTIRRTTSKQTQQSMARLSAMMQETLSVSGILLVKTFGREQYAQAKFEQENQRLTALEVRQQMIGRWFFMLTGTFFSVLPAFVYLIAGWQIIKNDPVFGVGMTLGTIVAFTTLQNRLFFPLGQLLGVQVEIQGALALFDRIFEYLDLPSEITDQPGALQLKPEEVRGEVTFNNVSFTYQRDGFAALSAFADKNEGAKRPLSPAPLSASLRDEEEERPTLTALSFQIKPGQLAALVGPSGAGKTTITYLVPRLYDVESGAVEIDGHNVKEIALSSLAGLIGMVTQETYLFHRPTCSTRPFAKTCCMRAPRPARKN